VAQRQSLRHNDHREPVVAINNNNDEPTPTTTTFTTTSNNPDFVHIPPTPHTKIDGWGAEPNLDIFFNSLYSYYYNRGSTSIISAGVVSTAILFFTLYLSVFVMQYVDWGKLRTCQSEESCENDLGGYIVERPFYGLTFWNLLIIIYMVLFLLYGVATMAKNFEGAKQSLKMKSFYEVSFIPSPLAL